MNATFDLTLMAVLMQQGRRLDRLSSGMLVIAVLALLAIAAGLMTPGALAATAFAACLVIGVVQQYVATRTDVDARLMDAMARMDDPRAAAIALDRSLHTLNLVKADALGRDWPARWRGMVGLLRAQAACTGAQLVFLCAAGGASWLHTRWGWP